MKRNSVKHAYLTLGLLLSIVVIGIIGYSLWFYNLRSRVPDHHHHCNGWF